MKNFQRELIVPLILVLAVLVIGGVFIYNNFSTQPLCWPYCANMTDEDREEIKRSVSEANQSEKDLRAKLQNATVHIFLHDGSEETDVTLKDAKYEYESIMCNPSLCSFTLRTRNPVFIDIDRDGDQDVVTVGENWNGGMKTFNEVIVFLNNDHQLRYVGSIDFGHVPTYNSISISENQISINYYTNDIGAGTWIDPISVTYRIENEKLRKVQ